MAIVNSCSAGDANTPANREVCLSVRFISTKEFKGLIEIVFVHVLTSNKAFVTRKLHLLYTVFINVYLSPFKTTVKASRNAGITSALNASI
jgi:hypothetical protein